MVEGKETAKCRARCLVSLCLAMLWVSGVAAQSATLSHTDLAGDPGDTATGEVILDTNVAVSGFSYDVCSDFATAFVLSATSGSATQTSLFGGPPDYEFLYADSSIIRHEVVICFGACAVLPPGGGYQLLVAQYQLTGSTGHIGEVCICSAIDPVVVYDASANPATLAIDCGRVSITPCTAIVPNRGIDRFEILPRTGQPGHFDVRVEWSAETASPSVDLSTDIEIEVGGQTVTATKTLTVGSDVCCGSPDCDASCGLWFMGGLLSMPGTCQPSPLQGDCACRIALVTAFDDIEIDEGQLATARLIPKSGSLADVITEDDEVSRLAPYFNRKLLRVAWLPDPDDPARVIAWGYVEVTASAVDAEIDFSYGLTADVPGGGTTASTEVELTSPDGVDPCVELDCGDACMVPDSGNTSATCRKSLCLLCTQAQGLEIGSLVIPPAGSGYEVFLEPLSLAFPEADPFDDSLAASYTGFVAAPNRSIRTAASGYQLSGVGLIDVDLAIRVETGGTVAEDLTSRLEIFVEGQQLDEFESPVILGASGGDCVGTACSGGSCPTWLVGGMPVTAECGFSDEQGVCACHIDLAHTFSGIAAEPGDTVTVRLKAARDGMPEIVSTANSWSFVVGGSFRRGDVNADGGIDLSDATTSLSGLFLSQPILCWDAADVDDDGHWSIVDAIALLAYLFQSGAPPEPPFPACGVDSTSDDLDCDAFPGCP